MYVCIYFLQQGETPLQKLTFYADKQALFLWAKGNSPNKTYVSMLEFKGSSKEEKPKYLAKQ